MAKNDSNVGKEPGLSIIAVGMVVTGELDTNGVVKVEGTIRGSVRAEKQVLVAKGGVVDGDVYTREAVIGGEVKGAIYADVRVEIQVDSAIHGDISTQSLMVQEGGEVNGNVRMENPDALSKTRASDNKASRANAPAKHQPQIV